MIESPFQTSAGHIEIDGQSLRILGFMSGQSEVGAADERSLLLDVPALYSDFSGGLGASEKFIPGMYGWGEFIDTFSCPGLVLPAGELKTVTGLLNHPHGVFGSWVSGTALDLYVAAGRTWYKINGGNDTVMQGQADLGSNVALQNAVEFGGYVYIGSSVANTGAVAALYRWDPATNTMSTAANVLYRHIAVVDWAPSGTPRPTLIGTVDHYRVQWNYGNPMVAGEWHPSTPLSVGTSADHIMSMISTPRHVFLGKQFGIRDMDERGRTPNLTPGWRSTYDIANGSAAAVMGSHVYVAHAFSIQRVSLTGERQDAPEVVWPPKLPFSGPFVGRCTAMVEWAGRLLVSIYNTKANKSYVLVLEEAPDGTVRFHGAYATVTGRMTHMAITAPSPLTNNPNYLYMFTANDVTGGQHAYRQDLPKAASSYQDLLWLQHMKFQPEGAYMVLPDGWPEYPTARRNVWRVDIEAQRMNGLQNVRVSANRDGNVDSGGATIWDEIGWSNTSGRASTISPENVPVDPALPDGDTEAFGSPARMMLRVDLEGTTTAPPVFMSLRVRADINHETPDLMIYTVDLRDNQESGIGTEERRQLRARLEHLKRLAGINSVRVSLRDEDNLIWRALVLKVEWPKQRYDHDSYISQPRIWVRKLYRSLQWDSGEQWGGEGVSSPGPWS